MCLGSCQWSNTNTFNFLHIFMSLPFLHLCDSTFESAFSLVCTSALSLIVSQSTMFNVFCLQHKAPTLIMKYYSEVFV